MVPFLASAYILHLLALMDFGLSCAHLSICAACTHSATAFWPFTSFGIEIDTRLLAQSYNMNNTLFPTTFSTMLDPV